MANKNYKRSLRRYVQYYLYSSKVRVRSLDNSKIRIFILCFIISFFIWLFQYFNAEHTTTLDFPIAVKTKTVPNQLIHTEKPPETIQVNVTGPGWSLLKYLFLPAPPLVFDLEHPLRETNLRTKELLPQFSTVYNDITVNEIMEDTVHFRYDTLTQKEVLIVVDSARIQLSPNHRIVSKLNYRPHSFTLTAPSTHMNIYPDTHFVRIAERGIQEDFEDDFEIDYLRNRTLSTINRDRVYVSFEVQPFNVYIRHLKLKLKYFPKAVRLDSSQLPAEIRYLVPRNITNRNRVDTVIVILNYRRRDRVKKQICPTIRGLDTLLEARVKPPCFNLIYLKN